MMSKLTQFLRDYTFGVSYDCFTNPTYTTIRLILKKYTYYALYSTVYNISLNIFNENDYRC